MKLAFPEAEQKTKSFAERKLEYTKSILSNSMIPANTENAPDTSAAAEYLARNDGGPQEGADAAAPAAATEGTVQPVLTRQPGDTDAMVLADAIEALKVPGVNKEVIKAFLVKEKIDPKKAGL
jgi:hypothetical protein